MNKKKRQLEKLGDILENVLKKSGLTQVVGEQQILDKWDEIVGENIAQNATAVRVEGGVIYVKTTSAAWRNELVFLKGDILKKANDFAGKRLVNDIIFTTHS